ncbi:MULTISPECIES: M24 family metallopeptidase [Bradyrhizobium]|jgi:Xaa-Pro aminopeptidase|uniref:Aminopeptidase P family protein n=1 Tax=Bradyrhizobium ottawaense TaxID=931866 RepID=A0A2U8P031_9BRAD|nr:MULTISPECIES: Xaa-Pro peptidase family protein [Bradyrhizobium]AWL91027.1 aminopeptidase P family protein [Bradyrhizobium ottawaense]MBR1329037.1 aminopeptidase P family protein [Bradyrhizobium ottawaense]MBR1335229.1 aminopeptidase P family protein [Bradyrhizobium ottawaense]MBR1364842.1 aminopeptidase P family protein [Bradyrhizobium ottawaense]MDA9418882.1 peptidase [Bradyrhizobium sp. CCBAU 25360]
MSATIPFSTVKLDGLLDDFNIDILIVTSKHNIQYLLGGYYHFQFDYMEAIGISRYLPIFVYVKGALDKSVYIANRNEGDSIQNRTIDGCWLPAVVFGSSTSVEAMTLALKHIKTMATPALRIGVEASFLPLDAADVLRTELPHCQLVEAMRPLEKLRSIKTAGELEILREASERVVASMMEAASQTGLGQSKREIIDRLRQAELSRDMTFEYALVTMGTSLNRAPSHQRLKPGDIISLDSGGNYRGYIGDLCRMAVHGTPDSELVDLLAEIDLIQQAARAPIRAGLMGSEIYAAATEALARSPHGKQLQFVAHGMGIVSHEAPRLMATGPIPYPADDAHVPLEAGMVISIETTLPHSRRGFIKLEDTIAVTATGFQAFGDDARDWYRISA